MADADVTPIVQSFEFVQVERRDRLTIIKLDRPAVLNALHGPAHHELHAIFDDFAADPDQWVAIVTGAGRAFCAGNDLKFQASGGSPDRPATGFAGLVSRFDLDKPLIAAVNGMAMGGGFEIALACDLVIASEDAVFALPEPRVGLAALAGGLHRLPRAIGWQQAMGIILTGRRVGAEEGTALGFVNAVVPADAVVAEARRWADMILECSPLSIRASKQVARRGLEAASVADAMRAQPEHRALQAMLASQDYRNGPRAFAQKRPQQWTGR